MITQTYEETETETEAERDSATMPPTPSSPSSSLVSELEELFSRAEPRLRRLARSQRVAPDTVDDVVQETLIVAWKSLEHLRDEARFAAWLDGICRNICLRYQRKQGVLRAHEAPLTPAESQPDDEADVFAQLADPNTFDPAEELTRQDMRALLDRALGYLSPESRAVVERRYLAETPQREVAAELGLSLSALEARLHRARGQMLRAFSHELRAEALALGLAILSADAVGWRKTQITCILCGRTRMQGTFEPMGDGRVNMRLRCPTCQTEEINTLGFVNLATARSFLPATKKAIHHIGQTILDALVLGGDTIQCRVCQRPTTFQVVRGDNPGAEYGMQTRLQSSCGCMSSGVSAVSPYGALPEVRDFIFGTGAIVLLPEIEMPYAGQPAIRLGLLSPSDGRRLYVFADTQTLAPLAVIVE